MERMEDLNATGRMHKVTMTNRRTCTVNGVNDVLSFDLREILLETEQGMLMIRGNPRRLVRSAIKPTQKVVCPRARKVSGWFRRDL